MTSSIRTPKEAMPRIGVPKKWRRFHGVLTPLNAQGIVAKMEEVFAGKKFAIAICRKKDTYQPAELRVDVHLESDWTDGPKDLVRAFSDDTYTSICFSAGHYFYTFLSRAREGCERTNDDAKFSYDTDQLTIREGDNTYIFGVQNETEIES